VDRGPWRRRVTIDVAQGTVIKQFDRVVLDDRVWVVWAVEPVDDKQRLFVRPLRKEER
jgi:hypothetical protein